MTTDRLSSLALIHRNKTISAEHVVDVFARSKERQLALIFNVYISFNAFAFV